MEGVVIEQLLVTRAFRQTVWELAHATPTRGHLG